MEPDVEWAADPEFLAGIAAELAVDEQRALGEARRRSGLDGDALAAWLEARAVAYECALRIAGRQFASPRWREEFRGLRAVRDGVEVPSDGAAAEFVAEWRRRWAARSLGERALMIGGGDPELRAADVAETLRRVMGPPPS